MANNVKIVGQILNTDIVNRYTIQDEQLMIPTLLQETFGQPSDYIEYFVFDIAGNILNSDYNYQAYKLPPQSAYSQSLLPDLEIDPIQDIQNLGYESGEVTARYNFFKKIAGEPLSNQLFIQQISSTRTEIEVSSTILSSEELLSIASNYLDKQNSVPYYYYLILNFGNNNQVIAVNVQSIVNDEGQVSILFKLYQPLPANVNVKDTFWIVEEIINPYIFDVNLDKLITPLPQPALKGPNFDIDLELKNVVPTPYNNYYQLISSLTGSYYQTVLNSVSNQQTNININYSLLNDFIHFSSAENRLSNFVYKVGEIEQYQAEINYNTPLTASNVALVDSVNRASSSINEIISTFDGFESYLYFTSSSLTSSITEYTLETGSYFTYNIAPYPKSNSTQPYTLYASSSVTVQDWFATASSVAIAFDLDNSDILIDTIPSYIKEDPDNFLPYILFVNMIGQYFDNIWIYITKLTDVWDNTNNLNDGISKDLVYDWLQSFGVKLYNSQGNQDVLDYNVGGYSGSVVFNGDYSPSSSFLNNVPRKDLVQDTYKRIYHNLPYLFKAKGSHGGLEGLITLFGITGSILPIREYGGNKDSQDLKGYNLDKITLGTNTITGSVLSSIKRLETTTTSSRDVRSQDLHFIDVSFSPQNQINEAVSASITAVDPNWVIDDYIGNPTYLELNTYPSLSFQREYWFGETFDQSFDYGGFIRLIQFFDNSLFKMVKDFTPARGNTWTGVTIKSPVLERPKVAQYNPILINQTEPEGEITGAALIPVYDPYYFYLAGDKEPYYEGNISGSFIDTYAVFEENNRNPYLVNNTIGFVPPGFISGSTDFVLNTDVPRYDNFFLNSDFNTLQNNIDFNLESQYRKKLSPVYSVDSLGRTFISYSVTESVELQDSYLSLTAHEDSRYNGVQLYGRLFNTWSIGDQSYGQSPVINYYVKKMGLFTEVTDNIYLPYKSTVNLKYLVDETGRLTELNKRNRNWEEVQNTFETGDFLNVSLFDPKKYGNQSSTDGNKIIHESGYSYSPVFYAYGNESTPSIWSGSASFVSPEGSSQNVLDRYFTVYPKPGSIVPGGINPQTEYVSSSFISGGVTFEEVWSLFGNNVGEPTTPGTQTVSLYGNYFYTGSALNGANLGISSSYYVMSHEGNYQFNYNFLTNISAKTLAGVTKQVTASMQIWKSSSAGFETWDNNTQVAEFKGATYRANVGKPRIGYYNVTAQYTGQQFVAQNGYYIEEYPYSSATTYTKRFQVNDSTVTYINGVPYTGELYNQYTFYGYSTTTISEPTYIDGQLVDYTSTRDVIDKTSRTNLGTFWVRADQAYNIDVNYTKPGYTLYSSIFLTNVADSAFQSLRFKKSINLTANDFEVGDKFIFRFLIDNNNNNTEITSFTLGENGILQAEATDGTSVVQDLQICTDQNTLQDAFVLDPNLSTFFGPANLFNPLDAGTSGSYADLYSQYGEIVYPFNLQANDKVVIQAISPSASILEFTVDKIAFQGSPLQAYIYVKENINEYFNECNKFYKILFLKRVKDETSIIINLQKLPGKTSYGFSIPSNLDPVVLANIDLINKNVNQQLVDVGINTNA